MARVNPPKETQFKKGQVANPSGRPKMPPDLKKATKITSQDFIRTGTRLIYYTKAQLKKVMNDPKSTALEMLIASIIFKGVTQGDHKRLDFLLDRLIGKVTNHYKFDMENGPIVQQVVLKIPSNGRERDEDKNLKEPIEL